MFKGFFNTKYCCLYQTQRAKIGIVSGRRRYRHIQSGACHPLGRPGCLQRLASFRKRILPFLPAGQLIRNYVNAAVPVNWAVQPNRQDLGLPGAGKRRVPNTDHPTLCRPKQDCSFNPYKPSGIAGSFAASHDFFLIRRWTQRWHSAAKQIIDHLQRATSGLKNTHLTWWFLQFFFIESQAIPIVFFPNRNYYIASLVSGIPSIWIPRYPFPLHNWICIGRKRGYCLSS